MLSNLRNVFRIPELRNKILFTLAIIVLYRLGAHVPVPGVDYAAVEQLRNQSDSSSGILGFFTTFTGGALTGFAVFALGIMPYITASIIMQILGVVIPKVEQWREQGAVGQRKITQWTRYLAIALALVQATGVTFAFGRGGRNPLTGQEYNTPILPDFSLWRVLLVVVTLVAGTALLMWLGELITQRGIGNGMSILIFASVVSALPSQGWAVQEASSGFVFGGLIVLSLAVLVGIVIVENGQRRIPVQFAKRVVGRRMMGGQSTYIPLKVNQSGVVPIIFASSVLFLPTLLSQVLNNDAITRWVDDWVVSPSSPLHILLYGLMIVGFAYFYTAIMFDPIKQADQIRKQGGFIPGVRPGPQTERYLSKILNRITLPGALFIAVIALLPSVLLVAADVENFPFAGTTVLIAVGVALETMKQVDSQLMMRNYEGFLR